MKFGYARVSTTDQNLEMQISALDNYGVDKIFSDKATGKNMQRKEFIKLLEQLRKGDTLVIFSLSRLGRKTKDLIELIEKFNSEGISLVSLKESIDTNSPVGRAIIGMISIFAELERELITERVKEALALYHTEHYSVQEIIKKTGVSKATLYRRLSELEDKNENN